MQYLAQLGYSVFGNGMPPEFVPMHPKYSVQQQQLLSLSLRALGSLVSEFDHFMLLLSEEGVQT